MESKEIIKEKLREEGYQKIHEYVDEPNAEFPEHDHEGAQCMVVASGSICVRMSGQDNVLTSGSKLKIPAKEKHSAKVGPEGCESIVGEKA